MFDAWQNGGEYKGKPVTDDRLLSYIKQRRDGFSKDDPLWDEWNNRFTQYDFSIGEQKIGLQFKQGKVGAGAVAAYYRSKLKDIPKDSAFYREVAGRAAEWAKSVAGAARAGGRARAEAGVRDKLNKTIYAAAEYEQLELALTQYARAQGIIAGNQTLVDADATSLRDMFDRGIYVGETQLTFDAYTEASVGYYKNLDTQVRLQVKLGNQGIEARSKRDKFLTKTLVRLNTVDERSQYEMAREAWIEASQDAAGDPYAQQAADDRYLTQLAGIQRNAASDLDGTDSNDPEFVGGLINEINAISTGKATGPTVADIMSNTGEGVVTADAEDSAKAAAAKFADVEALESGAAYFGQVEPGDPLRVVPWNGPASLGFDDSLQPSMTVIGGQRRLVYLKGEEVKATSIVDAATSQPVNPATLTAEAIRQGISTGTMKVVEGVSLGYVFRNPTTNTTQYGVKDANGNMQFTDVNPWADEAGKGYVSGLTDSLSVITSTGEMRGDKFIPVYNKPIDYAQLDPILADSTVAPKDLLALAEQGIKGFSPEDVEAYKQKLQQREQARVQSMSNRDLGLQDRLGIGNVGYDGSISDPRDVRKSLTDGMDAVRSATQNLFGPGRMEKDDIYTPPPPKAPPIAAAPPPIATPKPLPKPSPSTYASPGGAAGSAAAAGSNKALERIKEKIKNEQLEIGSGQLGGGGR